MKVSFIPNHGRFTVPKKATKGSAGFDLEFLPIDNKPVVLMPGCAELLPTGCSVEIEEGHAMLILPRSGLAFKNGVTVLNAPGLIDSDYRGELKVLLVNHSKEPFKIEVGMRIAQFVITALPEVECIVGTEKSTTERGEGGFGSSGLL